MTIGFKIPSLSESRDMLVAVFKALFPDRNVSSPRAYHAKRLTPVAAGMTQLHAHIDKVQDNVMPDSASDDGGIDRWGGINGTKRKGASSAHQVGAGRVRGAAGTAVTAGQVMTHNASGLSFAIATSTTVAAGGFVDADIVAVDTGAQTRLGKGQILGFVSTPVGLETNVVLQKDLDQDGFDTEQFGSYRGRVLSTFSTPSSGGSQGDWVTWILQVDGFSQGYAYPNRIGIGAVDVVGLQGGTGANRIPNGAEMATLLAYLRTKAPMPLGASAGPLRVLTPIADSQSVEMTIQTDGLPSSLFDWADNPAPTVLLWTAATRTLQFAGGTLPTTLKAGHRIILKGVGSVQDGRQYTVEAISGVDTVILQTAPINVPVAPDVIYSGGPLVDPIRNAILAHMNGETVYAGKGGTPSPASSLDSTVGLEVLATGIGPANPAGIYGAWSGGLIRAVLGKLAIYKAGVRNYSIVTPAADYEATDFAVPLDAQIGLIVPSSIIVRSA